MTERVRADFVQLNKSTLRSARRQIMGLLSLFVVLGVFWCLKLTGITLAGEAFCGMEEHIHGDGCPTGRLICDQKETLGHVHDESCILHKLICEQEEVMPHVHDENCRYLELICPLEEQEGHTHDDSCRGLILICMEEEREGHTHDCDCFAPSLICTAAEEDLEHIHGPECYENILTCVMEEAEGHSHTDDCYRLGEDFVCGQEEAEGHTHGEECYLLHEDRFVCGMEETEGHLHTGECFYIGVGFGCGMTEEEGHVHTQDCLTDETELGCGKAYAPAHTHTEECYEALAECPLEEHIHVESCYSDINADLETEDDWEHSLRDVAEETSTAKMLAAVARSQLGCAESTLNFEVDYHGVRRGITRYGQWYGNPYGDWSAMFASFCLHYAGAEDLPVNAGPESMRLEWEKAGLYQPADVCTPQVGNLAFLRPDFDTEEGDESEAEPPEAVPMDLPEIDAASAVAIITEVTEDCITVIQGDLDNAVAERTLDADDPAILGYGLVPERSPFALMAAPAGDLAYLARTIDYSASMFTNGRSFVLYTERDGIYYAIDGNANAVLIELGDDGSIYTDAAVSDSLLWTFTRSNNRYVISNAGTGLYLHPFYNGPNDNGIINTTGWDTPLTPTGNGVRLIHSASVRLNAETTAFEITTAQNDASVFYFGVAEHCTVWLDGTNGGLMSLQGSDIENRSVISGGTITLPSQWRSPEKYSYTLCGWYDVGNRRYYAPGEAVSITEDMLFYADWAAATYDIGQMNGDVVDTVSTNEFITTHVFDYNSLFNTLSMNNNYTGGGSTRWTLVESGTVQTTGEETLNFIFVDYDDPGNPGSISYPINRNQANGVDYSRITSGLYNNKLADLLFDTDLAVAGKHYLGQGDHLFQYGEDPSDSEHYGYFYYDSMLNAASYHQSNGRFYVYDYLERTVDSASNQSYSDFLPLNSPYANTNGKTTGTYSYHGVHNEYIGTPHVTYDSKYSDSNNSPERMVTNYWFGMAMEMEFYLPSVPGTVDSEGVRANQSIVGDDMVFEFSGDDDVWVLIDGRLVLDIGGIHGEESGSIDFSTGDIIVDGVKTGTVTDLSPGSHTLTMYYLERGASMSNFKLRFNLSTRYSMNLRKEDTLTAHLLNGAQFAVYNDEDCTHPAELWDSRDAHENGEPATNIFTVENGVAAMWGLAAGNTYYLEEIRGPDSMLGIPARGVIRMRLNNQGMPDYEVLPDTHGDLTVGYTVHGYKVNEDLQEAYLVVTNTDATESEPTEVYVEKVWADDENHSGDTVTAYLLANGVRIQSVTLSRANRWRHTWVNLPQTDRNGVSILYTVQEATVPGYVGKVEEIEAPSGDGGASGGVTTANGFTDGQTYLLHTRFGYIGASGNTLQLESSQANAQSSNNTQWVADVHGDGTVTLTNKAGQTLYYDNYTFRAASSPGSNKNLSFSNGKLFCFIDHGGWSETLYPIDNDNVASNVVYNGVFYTTNTSAQALTVTPQMLGADEPTLPGGGSDNNFRITNTPIGEATISLRVNKLWDLGSLGTPSEYEETGVQMQLMANGEEAGLTATLSLRNGWSYTFTGLPKYDSGGNEIAYTVEEVDLHEIWRVVYGPVTSVDGSETAYETTVTNVYRATIELPSTGGMGPYGYITLGLLILFGSLGWYRGQRRKYERREW